MARLSPKDLKIELDNSGGSLTDISDSVTDFGGINVQAQTEEITPYSADWQEHGSLAVRFADQVTLTGISTDGANDLFALCAGHEGDTRTMKITYQNSGFFDSGEFIIMSCNRQAQRGQFQRITVTLQLSGALSNS